MAHEIFSDLQELGKEKLSRIKINPEIKLRMIPGSGGFLELQKVQKPDFTGPMQKAWQEMDGISASRKQLESRNQATWELMGKLKSTFQHIEESIDSAYDTFQKSDWGITRNAAIRLGYF